MLTKWKAIVRGVSVFAIVAGGLVACESGDHKSSDINADSSKVSGTSDTIQTTSASKTSKITKKRKTSATLLTSTGEKMTRDKEGVYNRTEPMPEFPGGQPALSAYVENHLNYPQQAVDDNKTGTVRVSFIVDETGKIINPHIVGNNKVGDGLDEEAVKVVKNMPAWKPGKVKGKNVKTRLELPITFQLEA